MLPRLTRSTASFQRWRRAVLFCVLGILPRGIAQEVQQHGLVFEQWVADAFFGGYRPASYTQPWDIPASANVAHGGVPVDG